MKNGLLNLARLADKLIGLIASYFVRVYQLTISPDHGILMRARYPYGYCSFYPTCSEYTRQSFKQRGFIVGLMLSIVRISRCYPGRKPTIDPIKTHS